MSYKEKYFKYKSKYLDFIKKEEHIRKTVLEITLLDKNIKNFYENFINDDYVDSNTSIRSTAGQLSVLSDLNSKSIKKIKINNQSDTYSIFFTLKDDKVFLLNVDKTTLPKLHEEIYIAWPMLHNLK